MDYIIDLPTTPRGNKHVSEYIKLYPVKDRTAKTAAKYVANYVLDLGIPAKLLSHMDPSYESDLFQNLMLIMGIVLKSFEQVAIDAVQMV